MKILQPVTLLLILAFSVSLTAQQKTFTFPEWRADFSVEFPAKPEVEANQKAQLFLKDAYLRADIRLLTADDKTAISGENFAELRKIVSSLGSGLSNFSATHGKNSTGIFVKGRGVKQPENAVIEMIMYFGKSHKILLSTAYQGSSQPPAVRNFYNSLKANSTVETGDFTSWVSFKPPAGQFNADFPAQPSYKVESGTQAGIKYDLHRYHLFLKSGGAGSITDEAFAVERMELPYYLKSDDANTLMQAYWGQFSKTLGGKVLTPKKLSAGSCEVWEQSTDFQEKGSMKLRMMLSGQQLFMVWYATSESRNPENRKSQHFFDSFKVADECKGGVAPEEAPPSAEAKTSFIEGSADPGTGWRKITSDKDGFSVLMPGRVKVEEQQIQVVPLPVWNRRYFSVGFETSCAVSVVGDYPADSFKNETSRQAMLDVTENSLKDDIKSTNGTVTFLRNMNVGEFPGREYNINTPTGRGRAQVFITSRKMYIILAIALSERSAEKNLDLFLKSLRISLK